jgi:hypothetical protein
MAYIVNNFNGSFLTSVGDGTIDTTTDIRFVGKNYAGYGEIQNENFLHLMENFANTTPPPRAIVGQIWYDSTSTEKKLKFWDGTNWRNVGGAKSQTTAPTGLTTGEFWWDTASKQLYAYDGANFVLVGPAPESDDSSAVARVVRDTGNNPHTIVEIKTGGTPVIVISDDADFELSAADILTIPGFGGNVIKKGVTLVGSSATNGTPLPGNPNYRFWGTTANSERLGGLGREGFVEKSAASFTTVARFSNDGFYLGANDNLRVWNDIDSIGAKGLIVESRQSSTAITIRILGDDVVSFNAQGLIPQNTDKSLGSTNNRWANVFANTVNSTNIVGNLTGNVTGNVTGSVFAANNALMVDHLTNIVGSPDGSTRFRGVFTGTFGSIETPANVNGQATSALSLSTPIGLAQAAVVDTPTSIPVRDQSGNVFANNFVATGSVNKADTLKVGSGFFSASSTTPIGANKTSIAARDSAGDIYAVLFRGTATAARYADLAEKYLADKDYETGTVVAIGGSAEVTACSEGDRAIGVVSANPAYMMNSELEGGTYIALKGRVPIKVEGPVKKSMRLVAGNNGTARAIEGSSSEVFAIALESSDDNGVKIIEALVL